MGRIVIHLEEIQGRVHLHMTVQRMGCDYTVTLYGGDAHVGAVALGEPEEAGTDATARVLTVPGHREGLLACKVAQRLASAVHARVCVACGIHWDHISADEIATVLRLAESLTHKAVTVLTDKQ